MTLLAACILTAALLVAGCGGAPSASTALSNGAPAPVAAKAAPAELADSALVVSGPIIVEHQVDLVAQRDGVIVKIFFDAPARVKAAAILARMDDRQVTANLEAARAKSRAIAADLKNWQSEAEVLKSDYARAQKAWNQGLIPQEQLEHAKYKAESDQWDVKRVEETLNTAHQEELSLELELEKAKITAPFTGLIARRYVQEGQSVAKGDKLFWVTAEGPLLMRFTLPERYFGHIRRAQSFELSSPDLPNEKHAARVKEISPVVDPSSGTFEVLVELIGAPGSFRPGMTATLRVDPPL